jgi:ribosomal protein S18 acetylase RimI-like enzyme
LDETHPQPHSFSFSFPLSTAFVGAKLLNIVLETARKDSSIIEVYLHVQTTNEDAKQFYLDNGFIQTEIIRDYYKRIEPPDCFLLKKSLKDDHEIEVKEGSQ